MRSVSRLLLCLLAMASAASAQVPTTLLGTWRIARILPITTNVACWDQDQANTLLGTRLTFAAHTLAWRGGTVPLVGLQAVSRILTPDQLLQEYRLYPKQLGLPAGSIREINLQHEDADITGATTEVPGDTVFVSSSTRIVVSACNVYYEAIRVRPKSQ